MKPGLRFKSAACLLVVAIHLSAGAQVASGNSGSPEDSGMQPALRPMPARLTLDYQVVKVRGDRAIDFLGFHVLNPITENLSLSVGAYAPLVHGAYGGFTAFDIGADYQQKLSGNWFWKAGLSAGGGGGGRSIEESSTLSGTGGYFKALAGLGYQFDGFSAGVNLSRMKFKNSAIDGTQANFFVEIPYSYLASSFSRHGQALTTDEAKLAAGSSGENMLTAVLDNFHQINPEGSYQGQLNVVDLQFAHFLATDTYWYAGLGVGYHGLPLYNQVLGGLGQRFRLSEKTRVYAQLGLGSGGYAPKLINTDSGLLVYPKLSAEYMLGKQLGISASAGYLMAPKGTSRNFTWGLALTQHLGEGASLDESGPRHFQAFRFSVLQQTDFNISYKDINRSAMQMVGVQADLVLNPRWYIPLQATVAYSPYLGYPGYGELLAGLGFETPNGKSWPQWFVQGMVGTNVHGPAVKASSGLRWALSERWSAQVGAGTLMARNSSGKRFSADSISLGLDYRFSVPTR